MAASYKPAPDLQAVWRAARDARAAAGIKSRLPCVLVMTDPRAPEPELDAWPGEVAVIFRHFGGHDRLATARRLREQTRARGHRLLIGADPEMAEAVEADGVHFRRDAALAGPLAWRARRPDWLISMAALKGGRTYAAPLDALDGLLVSPVFPSQSPSAGTPTGVEGLKGASRLGAPVFALGGVNAATVGRLRGAPIAGVAGVSFAPAGRQDGRQEQQGRTQ